MCSGHPLIRSATLCSFNPWLSCLWWQSTGFPYQSSSPFFPNRQITLVVELTSASPSKRTHTAASGQRQVFILPPDFPELVTHDSRFGFAKHRTGGNSNQLLTELPYAHPGAGHHGAVRRWPDQFGGNDPPPHAVLVSALSIPRNQHKDPARRGGVFICSFLWSFAVIEPRVHYPVPGNTLDTGDSLIAPLLLTFHTLHSPAPRFCN